MKKRETPCARCGWKYPGDHVCIDLSTEAARKDAQRVVLRPRNAVYRPVSERTKEALRQSAAERWQRHYESNRERDARIVERYNAGGVSQPTLAMEFDISKSTVQKILKRAAVEGLTTMRKRGSNIRHGAYSVGEES